jgi:hypothetical protein
MCDADQEQQEQSTMAMHHSNHFVSTAQAARVTKVLVLLYALALQSACSGTGDASGVGEAEDTVDPVAWHEDYLESGEGDAVPSEPGGEAESDEDAVPSEDALEREDALHEDQVALLPEDFPEATPVDEQSMTWEGGEVALTNPEANRQHGPYDPFPLFRCCAHRVRLVLEVANRVPSER